MAVTDPPADGERSAVHPDNGVTPIVVRGDGIATERHYRDVATDEVHRRFGGLDLPAALAGALAAIGLLVVLSGLLAGAGSVGYQEGLHNRSTLSLGGLIGGLVVLAVSVLFGGWVAGRMARYDGARNGLLTALVMVLVTVALGAVAAVAGSKYDIASKAHLPTWVTSGATSIRALITGLVALIVVLIAGFIGGKVGARWHRRVDDVLTRARPGGLTRRRAALKGTGR